MFLPILDYNNFAWFISSLLFSDNTMFESSYSHICRIVDLYIAMTIFGNEEMSEFQQGQITGWYQCASQIEKLQSFSKLIIKRLLIFSRN